MVYVAGVWYRITNATQSQRKVSAVCKGILTKDPQRVKLLREGKKKETD